ncbi:urease accessory protein UreD (plasmid) [Paracoccus methylovorus]|uniref:Urease accessory protein UreD n=1 Tax=Paracoccus methylovorus TaxID=2812658 RepID=A0ABX7JPJ5_9RHOB|nr:urease accessory protein UreD [Paracoccus methylovorus]QRZ14547.1 urease accessory protein UreD [Paracoccus methylovorus]
MLDTSTDTRMQRSRGAAKVRLGPRGLVDLAQSGSAKAMLPRVTAGRPEIVFLNTAGGLASGDRLDYRIELTAGAQALATTQTAERAYRAEGGPARVTLHLQVGKGGWLDWLPQETILFNGAALQRDTVVELATGAGCLLLEPIVLGRIAMGEDLRRLHLIDRRIVRQAGRVIHHDALTLDDAALSRLSHPSMLGNARAMATLALIAPHAPDLLEPARAALDEPGVTGAASAPPGRLILRLLAADGWPLRRQINRLLRVLRPDPLPRIWQV